MRTARPLAALGSLALTACIDLSPPGELAMVHPPRPGAPDAGAAVPSPPDGSLDVARAPASGADAAAAEDARAAQSLDAPADRAAPEVRPEASGPEGPAVSPPDAASAPRNQPPVVRAGPHQTVLVVGAPAQLAGSVSDDGLPVPPGKVTLSWTKVSGPGTVSFTDAAAPATQAQVSAPGVYVLRLTASDGALSAQDETRLTVLGLDVGLVGHWRFDEGTGTTAADASGGGNHGTLVGGAAWATGRIGKALDVSKGDADYVRIPHPPNGRLDFGTGDFTVCLWFKTKQVPAENAFPELVNKMRVADPRAGYDVFLWTWEGTTRTTFQIWERTSSAADVLALPDDQWHHLCARKTATTIELVFDGVARGPQRHAFGNLSTPAPVQVGGHDGQAWADYDGLIDDLRLYKRALDDAEVAALASGQSP